MFTTMIIAGIGGFFGTCARYLTCIMAKNIFGSSYPVGTLAVNAIGCLIMGLLLGLLTNAATLDPLLITGFSSGYTTFSSFALDSYKMMVKAQWFKLLLYVIPSIALGLMMMWLGMSISGY